MGMSERAKRRSCCASARLASRSVSEARPSRPARHHLHVALERLGVVVERHEPDVRLVDPHPEGGRCDDRLDPAFDEGLLSGCAFGRLEPGVVVNGCQVVGAQRARQALAAAPGARVDDRGLAAQLVQPADERPQPRLLAVDDLDVVAEIRPDDAGRTISGSRPRATAISRSVAGVAVAVMPRIAGLPRASSARRMKR